MLFYIPGLIYTLTKIKSKEYSYDKIDMECKTKEKKKSDFIDTKSETLEVEEEDFEEFEEVEDLNKLRKKLLL